jgi:hypothetical protein
MRDSSSDFLSSSFSGRLTVPVTLGSNAFGTTWEMMHLNTLLRATRAYRTVGFWSQAFCHACTSQNTFTIMAACNIGGIHTRDLTSDDGMERNLPLDDWREDENYGWQR